MGIRRRLAMLGLLALPPIGLGYALESIVRRNAFKTGPHQRGAPEATDVPFEQARFWTADGQQLEGWLFEGGDLPATVLFMHGTNYNASDMWATEERARLFGSFLRGIGCRFFVFDYRGYGPNDGEASEGGTYLDAEAALGYLHNRPEIDAGRMIFYGFSLGTGVAVELALREPCAGLVLRAPFTSLRSLMAERYPRLRRPLALLPWLPMTRYNSEAKIPRIRVPLLVMHGDADESVPQWMGRRLYDLAPGPKTFVSFPGAAHQDFPLEIMVPALRRFVEEVSGVRAAS
ncbi:MAG: alpha/beta fold hydrolase [Dehalococcoidia bacterium]|nr:alpha/beta fold hydrolase [Dehalococcoidia bacterium]